MVHQAFVYCNIMIILMISIVICKMIQTGLEKKTLNMIMTKKLPLLIEFIKMVTITLVL